MLGILGRVFSFSSWQQHHPAEQPPGDMLDASFDAVIRRIGELEARIDAFLRADGKLAAGTVTPDALAFPFAGKTGKITFSVGPGEQNPKIGVEVGSSSDSSAEIWAYASKDWAEHMPDTIPGDSVAVMGVTGDHWSSRWWANYASLIVEEGLGTPGPQGPPGVPGAAYVGDEPPHPAVGTGALWWESDSANLYVWYQDQDSGQWIQITGPTGTAGVAGTSMFNGPGVPDPALGNDGDSYFDTDTGDLYTKDGGVWTLSGDIFGTIPEDIEVDANRAEAAADDAEAARDASFVNANIYPDEPTGRAAVADGAQFNFPSGDGWYIFRHQRDSVSASHLVATYPTGKVATVVSDASDVLAQTPDGINLDINYSGAVNGTDIATIGTPPLIKIGTPVMTTVGGFAVSPAGTATATPAVYHHQPNDPEAVLRVHVDTTGLTNAQAVGVGALIEVEAAGGGYVWFAYARETSLIYFRRLEGGAITNISTQASGLPITVTKWVFEVRQLPLNQHSVVLELPDGTRTAPYVINDYATANAVNPFRPAFGIYANQVGVKISKVTIDTNVTAAVQRIEALETKNEGFLALPIRGEPRGAVQRHVRFGKAFDKRYDLSEAFLIDSFDAPYNTPFPGTHVSDFTSDISVPGPWTILGTAPWVIKDGLAVTATGPSVAYAASGYAMAVRDLPPGYLRRMRGIEVRAKVWVPPTTATGVAVVFRYDEGIYPGHGPGTLIVTWSLGNLLIQSKQDNAAETASNYTYFTTTFAPALTGGREIDFCVRIYRGETEHNAADGNRAKGDVNDIIIVEIDGIRAAAVQYAKTVPQIVRSGFRAFKSVGFGISTTFNQGQQVRLREFTVGPVPRTGSSRFRSLPPEPAPLVPAFTKVGLVFDGINNNPGVGSSKLLGPHIIPILDYAARLGISPVNNYYMYYSSDHTSGEGGIWLATAPNPEGPWTNYNGTAGSNRIYVDTVTGSQTEQPLVLYDEDLNRLNLYYHNRDVDGAPRQETMVATSPDGITWTRVGKAFDTSERLLAQYVNHSGYSSMAYRDPLGIVPGWVGWSRLTGGTGSEGGLSSFFTTCRSKDGLTWTTDLLPISIPTFNDLPRHAQWKWTNLGHSNGPFAYWGQRLMPLQGFDSTGLVNEGGGYLAISRMGDDLRSLSSDEYVIQRTLSTEINFGWFCGQFVRGNILYLYYVYDRQYVHLLTADLSLPPEGRVREYN